MANDPNPDDESTDAGMPRGLKIFLAVIAVAVAAFVVIHLFGGGLTHHGM